MGNTAAIRRLTPADVDAYRAIRLATLAREPEFFGATYAVEAARPLADFSVVLGLSSVFGAYAGSDIVGVIRLTQETGAKESHKGVVQGFFVQPERRQQGWGTALMAALIESARCRVEQLTLRVVRENESAIALYRRFGFATYGIEPRERRSVRGYSDIVMMVLFLAGDPIDAAAR
jgi:ribosomal protein S18 acetylase RimI-like enzyme